MRFLVDAQLPPALAWLIDNLSHSAEHVMDCGLQAASDAAIRNHAARIGAIIITKDEDFAVHRVLHDGPPVIWVRLGNVRRPGLLARMQAEFPAIVAALERGDTLIEIA